MAGLLRSKRQCVHVSSVAIAHILDPFPGMLFELDSGLYKDICLTVMIKAHSLLRKSWHLTPFILLSQLSNGIIVSFSCRGENRIGEVETYLGSHSYKIAEQGLNPDLPGYSISAFNLCLALNPPDSRKRERLPQAFLWCPLFPRTGCQRVWELVLEMNTVPGKQHRSSK